MTAILNANDTQTTTETKPLASVALDAPVVAISKAAAPDDGRPVLACVNINRAKGRAEVADGFALMTVDLVEAGDTPVLQGDEQHATLPDDFDSILLSAKGLQRANTYSRGGYLITNGDVVNGKFVYGLSMAMMLGNFPDVEQIFPVDPVAGHITLNVPLLKKVIDAMAKAGAGTVDISIGTKAHGPLELAARIGDEPTDGSNPRMVRALIMPMVISDWALGKPGTFAAGRPNTFRNRPYGDDIPVNKT